MEVDEEEDHGRPCPLTPPPKTQRNCTPIHALTEKAVTAISPNTDNFSDDKHANRRQSKSVDPSMSFAPSWAALPELFLIVGWERMRCLDFNAPTFTPSTEVNTFTNSPAASPMKTKSKYAILLTHRNHMRFLQASLSSWKQLSVLPSGTHEFLLFSH